MLQAGGHAVARHVSPLYEDVVATEYWPGSWTGGRLAEIHKHKGPTDECDEYRGIVLECHLGKGLKELMAPHVNAPVNTHMPAAQHGAVPGKGTDLACHLVLAFLQWSLMRGWGVFALFIDLSKAFDRVIRELAMGFPAHCTDPVAYLRSLGCSDRQASWIAAWVARRRRGSADADAWLRTAYVHSRTTDLIA